MSKRIAAKFPPKNDVFVNEDLEATVAQVEPLGFPLLLPLSQCFVRDPAAKIKQEMDEALAASFMQAVGLHGELQKTRSERDRAGPGHGARQCGRLCGAG